MNIPESQITVTRHPDPYERGMTCGLHIPAITVEHVPTGISATSRYARSMLKNKQVALEMVEYGLMAIGITQEDLDNPR